MKISGSTPKLPGVMKIWYVKLGPVFSTDELSIRTKDNAVLRVRLRYKWRFKMDPDHPAKIFAVEDFIGFATETMAGLIREEAAKFNFEEFHSGAARIIKNIVFGPDCEEGTSGEGTDIALDKCSYVFEENGFEIFGIDVKSIVPEDPEIAAQLNAAIKSNMDVYVQKIQQTAQLEAERQLVEGRIGIEKAKVELIELEQANLKARELGKAKITAEAAIERARGEAESIVIKKTAENETDAKRIELIINKLKEDGEQSYIDLQRALIKP
jgi:major vault protein